MCTVLSGACTALCDVEYSPLLFTLGNTMLHLTYNTRTHDSNTAKHYTNATDENPPLSAWPNFENDAMFCKVNESLNTAWTNWPSAHFSCTQCARPNVLQTSHTLLPPQKHTKIWLTHPMSLATNNWASFFAYCLLCSTFLLLIMWPSN